MCPSIAPNRADVGREITIAPLLSAWTLAPPLALLVDRDANARTMYAEYLKLSGCVIDEAEDGREALAKAIARLPDIIVTDTWLPGINGFELCRLLRRDASTSGIPIVFISANAFEGDDTRAKAAGADSVLIRPCLPETLLAAIHTLLDRPLRRLGEAVRETLAVQAARSDELTRPAPVPLGRTRLSRAHNRHDTTEPPATPPALVCPDCDQPLNYQRSHVGGVNAQHAEQWDYFECSGSCGVFQYRQRTRKLRKV